MFFENKVSERSEIFGLLMIEGEKSYIVDCETLTYFECRSE
jgi:hypothetical protein